VSAVTQSGPLGLLPETAGAMNLAGHNAAMSLGYVLALARGGKSSLQMLDWGGGIGHTYLLARALLPQTNLGYTCCDVPLLAAHGAQLFPEQTFLSDSTWKDSAYDLVMSSGALHFAEDWAQLVTDLAAAARRYFYIAKLPVVLRSDSFVFIQRPYRYGYGTEYLSWCLNRGELLAVATGCGLSLVREFIYGHRPPIRNAPEQNEYRGFLFEAATSGGATGDETD
jgi:putative methyltransferase (TIGR04325 family)